jgi:hypothetical protein
MQVNVFAIDVPECIEAGTLLIPGIVAGQMIQSLVNARQDLDRKHREAMGGAIPTGKMAS